MYTLEEHLRFCSESTNKLMPLQTSYFEIKEKMKQYLPVILSIYPHYSGHDSYHSETIITAIERILGEKRIKNLTAADTWMILCCAYMHDIGMIVTHAEERKIWNSQEFQDFLECCRAGYDSDFARAAVLTEASLEKMERFKMQDWPLDVKQALTLLTAEFIRRKHASRARSHLSADQSGLKNLFNLMFGGFITKRTKDLISEIARMHNCDFQHVLASLERNDSILGNDMHPRFVAVLIRLGDLCDVDNGRFNEVANAVYGDLPQSSLVHFYKHETITRVYISDTLIDIAANVDFETIKADLAKRGDCNCLGQKNSGEDFCFKVINEHQKWFKYIEDEIKNIKLHWHEIAPLEFAEKIPYFIYEIKVDGRASKFSHKNLRFNFSRDKAYELIEGYSLYNNKLTFVRELVQNSLDALKFQMWRDIKSGFYDEKLTMFFKKHEHSENKKPYSLLAPFDFDDNSIYDRYKINIKIEHEEGAKTASFAISDNGIGICLNDIEQNIIKTGSSWSDRENYRDELKEMPPWLRPTGGFGIGLHSVFAVTDMFSIHTKTQYEPHANELIVHSGKEEGFVFVRTLVSAPKRQGTDIEFSIDLERVSDLLDNAENDPLEKSPGNPLAARIERELSEIIRSPLFDIWVNEKPLGKMLYKNEAYLEIFDHAWRNKLINDTYTSDKNFDIAFKKDFRSFILWDREYGRFYHISFNELKGWRNVFISYKGILLKDFIHLEFYPGLFLHEMDVISEDTKKTVTANRNDLQREMYDCLKKRLEDASQEIAEFAQRFILQALSYKSYAELKSLCSKVAKRLSDKAITAAEALKMIDDKYKEWGFPQYAKYIYTYIVLLEISKQLIIYSNDKLSLFTKKNIEELKQKHGNKISSENLIEYLKVLKLAELDFFSIYNMLLKLALIEYSEFDSEFLRDFGSDFGRKIGRKIGREFGREFGSDFGREFGLKSSLNFDSKYVLRFNNNFHSDFGSEFGRKYVRDFSRKFDSEFDIKFDSEFGRDFVSEFIHEFGSDFGRDFNREVNFKFDREFFRELKSDLNKIFGSILNENPLGFNAYKALISSFFIPIHKLLYLTSYIGSANKELIEKSEQLLERFDGYNYSYEFQECNNVCDILAKTELVCELNDFFSNYVVDALPFLKYLPCTKMELHETKLIITLNNQSREYVWVTAEKRARIAYLKKLMREIECENYMGGIIDLIIFEEFNNIIIANYPNRDDIFQRNYICPLWFRRYEAEKVFQEMMYEPDGFKEKTLQEDSMENLIQYVFLNRADKSVTKEDIRKTYGLIIDEMLEAAQELKKEREAEEAADLPTIADSEPAINEKEDGQ